MLCEKCHKQQASVFMELDVNGVMQEFYLCPSCASQKPKETNFFNTENRKTCVCNTSFDDIKESGYVGCPLCYQTFFEELKPIISSLHGHLEHKGKKPLSKQEQLRQQIEKAIQNKFFDLAKKLQRELDNLLEVTNE